MSRTKNVIANSVYGIASAILMILLNFVVRFFLVKSLGDEYYGLHSFYQSITNLFAVLEMGISSAVIIHLYEPIKDKRHEAIKEIMSFYRNIYIKIAIIFSILTILFGIFALPYIVQTTIQTSKVISFYIIFSASFTVNFLTYHKRSILFADQKNRVSAIYTMLAEFVFRGLQIIGLLIYPSYLLFLVLFISEKLFSNYLCNRYVINHYPYLVDYEDIRIDDSLKQIILNTIRPLFLFQIATTLQGTIPSLLMSSLLGNVSIIGYYANYQLVSSAIVLLYSQIGSAFTTSFGNLAVDKDIPAMENVYKKTTFLADSIAIILFAGYICCIQDFIQVIFGEHFLLPFRSVVIIALLMVVSLFNVTTISVQNAMGLHRLDVKYVIVQTFICAIFGFLGAKYYGMEGLFIGILTPSFFFTLILKGIIICRYIFNWSTIKYLLFLGKDIIKLVLVSIVAYVVTFNINTCSLILDFLLKGIISVMISGICLFFISYRNPYFKSIISLICRK